jgi:hypothetical protein
MEMATVMDRLRPKPAAPIGDGETAAHIRGLLDRERDRLAGLRGNLDQAREALDALLTDQALGQKVERREIERREAKVAGIEREVAEADSVVRVLSERLSHWDADEADRRFAANTARLRELSAAAPALEEQAIAAATRYVEACHRLLAVQREFDLVESETTGYRMAHRLPLGGIRRPASPPHVPESFARFAAKAAEWPQWIKQFRAQWKIGQ